MMSLRRPSLVVLAVTALCVAGCAQKSPPPEAAGHDTAAAPAVASPEGASSTIATEMPDTATTLTAYQWQLESASDTAGQSIAAFFPAPDKPLGLLFADGRINVTGSCNRMSAGFELLDTAQMQVSPGPSTMMACPPPLAEADAAIASFLSGTLQVAVAGEDGAPQLQLAASDGRTLTLIGTPTPETRFGGPGTRAFLEVSTEPCVAPAPTTPPCLMVRDRHFDEKGLASAPPGEWRALPTGIEGYTPVEGEQHVVRVKRFEQAGATGSQPTEHFVLDLVIETRTVGS